MTLRAEVEYHPLALEVRYIVGFAVFGAVGSKARQQEFSLFLEDDGASAEEDVGFDFIALLEELDGMFELEVVVMVVRLRSEPDFLNFLLLGVCLGLFLLFLLGVQEFLVIYDTANRGGGRRRYLNEVEVLLVRNMHSLLKRVDALFYVVADKAYLGHTTNLVVNTVWVFFNNATASRSGSNSCYCFKQLVVNTVTSRIGTQCLIFEKAHKSTTFF